MLKYDLEALPSNIEYFPIATMTQYELALLS